MAVGSGISAQAGWKSEAVYGTGVVVDIFLPIISESITNQIQQLESSAIYANALQLRTAQWAPGTKQVGGTLNLELYNLSLGTLLKHTFGTVNTSGAGPFTHTYTPGDLLGDSLTIQVGKPDVAGVVQPFTYTGCKVPSMTITATQGEYTKMSLDVVGQAETTVTALASASYNANLDPFTFIQSSLSIAGSAVATCSQVSLTIANAFKANRFNIGAATMLQPLQNGLQMVTGTATVEFESLTAYNRYVNGTTAALVLAMNDGTSTLTFTLNTRFDGTTPVVPGTDVLTFDIPFKALGTTDGAAVTAVLVNTDTSSA